MAICPDRVFFRKAGNTWVGPFQVSLRKPNAYVGVPLSRLSIQGIDGY